MKTLIFATAVMLVSFSSYAGWSGTGKVVSLTSHNGMHVISTTIEDITCDGSGKFWWPTNDEDSDDMLAIALAALMAEKDVRLVHNTETPECVFNVFNKATHIQINAN